jgi:hypothetical protein
VFLEFYRITLEHRAKLVSIIMVSGIAVAIPAAVDAYKARLDLYAKDKSLEIERVIQERETTLKDKEQKLNELQFRQNSIQAFSSTGLQQDIELRIRLAEIFRSAVRRRVQGEMERISTFADGTAREDKTAA